MGWLQAVTLGIAVVGATLGIFNAYWTVRRGVVHLKVRAKAMVISTGHITLCIEVINTGYIPVTITEIGFTTSRFAKKKLVVTDDFLRQTALPQRLDSRAGITMTVAPASLDDPEMRRPAYCFAKTACGVRVHSRMGREWQSEEADQFRAVARESAKSASHIP